jgi:preprotein translocase subunit YajC
MLWSTAFAQTAAGAPQQPSMLEMILPFVFIFGVMYLFVIRPQAKRQKEQQKFISELKRGDDVVLSNGIFGRIEGLTETVVTVEVADGVRIKVLRSQVAGTQSSAVAAVNPEGKK